LAVACSWAGAGEIAAASPALCTPTQRVMFHCAVGAKAVSLCADIEDGRIAALTYRYGTARRSELSHTVSSAAGLAANVTPLAPRASVRQLSFTRGDITYVLSQCVGSACAQSARLAALRGDRIVFNRPCRRTADDRAWFAPELARFGNDAANSEALTDLVKFDDVDHGIERLYLPR
jgi:hypothetical protein